MRRALPRIVTRLALATLLSPAACASSQGPSVSAAPESFDELFDDPLEPTIYDPLEPVNRTFFSLNENFDRFLIDPLSQAYGFVVPTFARRAIRGVFVNLNFPAIFVNDLLQLRFKDAATTFGRFALNSTLGFGGLLDPGTAAGWERHDSDFGQTLGKMGVATGPYIVLPVFGPKTVRDGFGDVVGLASQPLTDILGPAEWLFQVYIGSGNGLTILEDSHDEVEALEGASVDFYAAMRSAYLQSRRAVTAPDEPLEVEDPVWHEIEVVGAGQGASDRAPEHEVVVEGVGGMDPRKPLAIRLLASQLADGGLLRRVGGDQLAAAVVRCRALVAHPLEQADPFAELEFAHDGVRRRQLRRPTSCPRPPAANVSAVLLPRASTLRHRPTASETLARPARANRPQCVNTQPPNVSATSS